MLATGRSKLLTYGITDDQAWNVGLPCGGEIDVFLAPLDDSIVGRAREVFARGERGAVLTSLEGADGSSFVAEGEREEVDELIRARRNTIVELEGKRSFVEILGHPPRLLVFGGLDTAESLCAAAKLIGWRTIVADARARFATRERVPSADELVVAWPEDVLAQVRPDHDTAVVVLTHDDRFDVPALLGALATEAFYIAALGSRRNQERRRELLSEAGVGEDDLARAAEETASRVLEDADAPRKEPA